MLEPLVPSESSQDKGNFLVRSRPEENYPEWKPAFKLYLNVTLAGHTVHIACIATSTKLSPN